MGDEIKFNKIQKKYLSDTPVGKRIKEQETPKEEKKFNPIQRKYLGRAGWAFDGSGAVKTAPRPGTITPRQISAAPTPKQPKPTAAPTLQPKSSQKDPAPLYGGAGKGNRQPEIRTKTPEQTIFAPKPLPGLPSRKEKAQPLPALWSGDKSAYSGQPTADRKKTNTENGIASFGSFRKEEKKETVTRFALPEADDPFWERWAYTENRASLADRPRREGERLPGRERLRPLSAGGRLQHEDMPLDEFMGVTPYIGDKLSDPTTDTALPSGGARTESRNDGDPIRYFDNNGQQVWTDMSTLQGIGVLPDGTYINTTGDAYADALYEIIRAEAAGEISEDEASWQKAELARQIAANEYPDNREEQEKLYRDRLSVFLNRDISYYTEIPDVTERMKEIMLDAEKIMQDELRPYYSEGGATEGIMDYYSEKVTTGGPYDIKEWPEFQAHSLFIFKGEIVSRDALGNILAGYLAKVCYIMDFPLRVGAGLNQISNKTARWRWFWNFGEDPRDTKRVKQGYKVYSEMH